MRQDHLSLLMVFWRVRQIQTFLFWFAQQFMIQNRKALVIKVLQVYNQIVATMIGQDTRINKIHNLLPQTERIRNVSIVAHVDHGKTTLADCLIASNGIIHKKQAGQLKLLDDRIDEQNRGITMKSSSICLLSNDHLINLIDSPGHLQFYCEVSAALRLTDAALLLVDVVQGVSSQTFRVLSQLYSEKLPSILVLNKIDKLITHCKMDPMEAYSHINQIIEQVNAILGTFIMKQCGNKERGRTKSEDLSDQKIEQLQNKFYFSTTKKNIIFGSALDNWGFAVEKFGNLLAGKLGQDPQKVSKYMWGQYYYHPKKKQFSEQPKNQNDRPLCVDFILRPIWDVFEAVQSQDKAKVENIITKMKLKVSQVAKKNYNYHLIKQIMNSWLPLDKIVLSRIIQILPNPRQAQAFRLPYLLNLNSNTEEIAPEVHHAISKCSSDQKQPLIVFISKMVNIPKSNFNERGLNEIDGEGKMRALGFGRIFSGKISRGDEVLLIGAKKKKVTNQKGQIVQMPDLTSTKIQNLYVFNAQYPEGVQTAYAGNVIGVGSLENHIYKSGTISTIPNCISFIPVASQTKSILKVNISTPQIQDNQKMIQGLKKLNKSDPSVQVYIEKNGNIALSTCGEVHLEKCMVDLQQIYCKIPLKVSEPIVDFRETIVWTNPMQKKNEKYIEEIKRKRDEKMKKIMRQKFKQEMKVDAQLDEQEKQKLKAIQEWDFHVQKYDSEDLTVMDTRFFMKNRDDEEEQKFTYKDQKQIKKADHKNKGKLHSKQKFLNLNLKTNVASLLIPNQMMKLTVKALGMDFQFAEYLQKNSDRMKKIFSTQSVFRKQNPQSFHLQLLEFIQQFKEKMQQFSVDENLRKIIIQNIVSFGPNGYGPNILCIPKIDKKFLLFDRLLNQRELQSKQTYLQVNEEVQKLLNDYNTCTYEILNSILSGFSIACTSGPLCNEPIMGVVFILQNIERCEPPKTEEFMKFVKQGEESVAKQQPKVEMTEKKVMEEGEEGPKGNKMFMDSFGPLSGQVMSTIKDVCIQAFLGGSPRIVQPMYLCQLQTDQQYYGQIYNQLSKRRAKVLSEDLHQFSNVFIIKALLPIIESFKFCFQILDRTQGTVNAQLNFDTWKIYTEDPFYTPLTQEEIEEDGLESVGHNSARMLLQKVRQKKGLSTTEKIVAAAEKQRTLKKK